MPLAKEMNQSQILLDFARLQQEANTGAGSISNMATPWPPLPTKERGIDLQFAATQPPLEMLRYVQKCCHDYANELDKRYPDVRKVMGRLVKTNSDLVPCDVYNQSGTCNRVRGDGQIVHPDENGSRRIHSCSMCYFSMGGMINLHHQNQCPLLDLIWTRSLERIWTNACLSLFY